MGMQHDKRLDCSACGATQSMAPAKVSKMSDVVRLIGWLIAAPSILGVLFAVLLFVMGLVGASGAQDEAAAGLGIMASGGTALCIGMSSLISGLIGYLLIMKKKVWKCSQCGYHIDRD